jgi:hypothetical protein
MCSGLDEDPSTAAEPQAALKRCMSHIRDVRKTRYIRKALIPPLRGALALLRKQGGGGGAGGAGGMMGGGMGGSGGPSVAVDDAKVAGTNTSIAEYLEHADLKVRVGF